MAPSRLVVFCLLLLTFLHSPVPAEIDVNEPYFLLTNYPNLVVLNLQGEVQHEISYTDSWEVDFDPTTARIFWPNRYGDTINAAFLNESQGTILQQLHSGWFLGGIAVDYILQLVFYSNYIQNLIGVMDTDGGSHRIVRDQGFASAEVLAVDVIHEYLYYTESKDPGNIGRMDYNGSRHEILLSGLKTPHGLALDVRGGRMYWSTRDDGRIESAGLNGTDRTLVLQDQTRQCGLAFCDGVLYFTVCFVRSIFSVKINGTDRQQLNISVPGNYEDIAVYSKTQAVTLEEKLAALSLTAEPGVAVSPVRESFQSATPLLSALRDVTLTLY